jgi:succinate-semialdehyde dehydrogenase / glutarate-semialdehyde dehydrogenase
MSGRAPTYPAAMTDLATERRSDLLDPQLIDRLATGIVAGADAPRQRVLAPFTGEPLVDVPMSSVEDVERAYVDAREAQQSWAARSVADRADVLLRWHDLVLDHRMELVDVVQAESGKARLSAYEEVVDLALHCRYYARRGRALLRRRRATGLVPVLTRGYEVRHPKGVVGIVSPWNYPIVTAVCDAVPALLAGNGVVLRPDTQVTLSALRVRELAIRAGVPEGLWQVVAGPGRVVGQAVVDGGDYVQFTGSTGTGRQVALSAARRLVGTSLELGGKNPLLVLSDADLDRAAAGTARAISANAGQLCVSIERVLVDRAVADAFVPRLVEAMRRLRLGAGDDWSVEVGTLVSADQLERVSGYVDDAVARGARVLTGGRARPDLGPYFYEPTLLDGVTPDMPACTEEVFGPVAWVATAADDDALVEAANDSPYGLNASVWTSDLRRGRAVAERIRCGTVNVNEVYGATWSATGLPMGGMGDSGLGRRHGPEGLQKFTESQTVAWQRGFPLAPFGPFTAEHFERATTAWLRVAKAAHLR